MHVNRKGIEVQQPLQETELNIHRKGFIIPKLFQVIKVKAIKHFCFQAFNFALKKVRASGNSLVDCHQLG